MPVVISSLRAGFTCLSVMSLISFQGMSPGGSAQAGAMENKKGAELNPIETLEHRNDVRAQHQGIKSRGKYRHEGNTPMQSISHLYLEFRTKYRF